MNALTVDVEDWYQTSDFNFPVTTWGNYEDRVDGNTRRVLDLFDEFGVKGTFFVLGCVAEKSPQLLREILARGHEIGSHGGWHQMLTQMSWDEITDDIRYGKRILEDISGQSVKYFRAPSWSLSPRTYRVLELLESEGFMCDSSLQPFHTPLSGVRGAPHFPFRPALNGKVLNLIEYPSTVLKFGRGTLPFAGGLYLRVLPTFFIQWALRKVNAQRPGMVYVHPWEFDPDQPRITNSPLLRFTHYYHLTATEPKLRALFKQFDFGPLGDVIQDRKFPVVSLMSNEGV